MIRTSTTTEKLVEKLAEYIFNKYHSFKLREFWGGFQHYALFHSKETDYKSVTILLIYSYLKIFCQAGILIVNELLSFIAYVINLMMKMDRLIN